MPASPSRRLLGLLNLSITAALFATLAVGGASAATVTQKTTSECTTYDLRTNWTNPSQLSLAQFNPALGTLVDVDLTRKVAVQSDLKFESTDSTAVQSSTRSVASAS